MQSERFLVVVIVICLAGLVWLLPLAILPASALKNSITAGGVFLTLVLSGVFYALRKNDTGE
jgi:NADH:ubiquinone oxidoreductase subunit 3 (subunit A)